MAHLKKYPRLYCEATLGQGKIIDLEQGQVHYLRNVLRAEQGSCLRLFNGQDGEWIAEINEISKKKATAQVTKCSREKQLDMQQRILIFAPIKKTETDFVIQKATELGVTDIYPVLTDHSNTHKIRKDRFETIAIEAAEQSERLSLPNIHDLQPIKSVLSACLKELSVYVAMERYEGQTNFEKPVDGWAVIIGPEGGFSDAEKEAFLSAKGIIPLSLGDTVLRAETAAIAALSVLSFSA